MFDDPPTPPRVTKASINNILANVWVRGVVDCNGAFANEPFVVGHWTLARLRRSLLENNDSVRSCWSSRLVEISRGMPNDLA